MKTYLEEYAAYLKEHIKNVQKAFNWLLEHKINEKLNFGDLKTLRFNIQNHDASKWSHEEFEAYAKYFYTNENNEANFNKAWNHHQKVNPHHWQYWVLIQEDTNADRYKCLPMDIEYIVEMVCDWWSFSFKKSDLTEIFSWYNKNKSNWIIHPRTTRYIEKLLSYMEEALELEEEEKDK